MNTSLTDPALSPGPLEDDDVDRQRAEIAALGHELRALVDATVRTAATAETLRLVTEGVRRLTTQLAGRRRARAEIPAVDGFPVGIRMYSPVTGLGSPLSPPLEVTPADGALVGWCALGIAHEGPPGYGHGGMSAMLLDELMGRACAAAGTPAMTVSLHLRYHRPVPLQTPLRLVAQVTHTEGRKVVVDASITTEADPGTSLVTADGVFIAPAPDAVGALFPHRPATR
jgi:hypothetical protein